MFAELMTALARGGQPDPVRLRQWFRVALTKKMAVVRLPPAFWMQDPKINPRVDHLLWAALLLDDREGVEMVSAIIAVELAEQRPGNRATLDERCALLAAELLRLVPADRRARLQRQVARLLAPCEPRSADAAPAASQAIGLSRNSRM